MSSYSTLLFCRPLLTDKCAGLQQYVPFQQFLDSFSPKTV